MKIEKVNIKNVKPNPNNPRIIKNDKFHKLVKSIQDFPKMLEIRPIVVNEDMVVLGGNMRLKACKEAGLKEVYIIKADDLSKSEQDEFLIKDNVNFGQWDAEMLSESYQMEKLLEWGMSINDLAIEQASNNVDEEEENDDPVYPIAPIMNEKHDYVMILAKDEIEYAHLLTYFDIPIMQDYKCERVGQGRVITFEHFKKVTDERGS